jgi:hypothetical protein
MLLQLGPDHNHLRPNHSRGPHLSAIPFAIDMSDSEVDSPISPKEGVEAQTFQAQMFRVAWSTGGL